MGSLEDILVPIVAMITTFGSMFGIAYIFFTTRHRERMSMIEKGADPVLFQSQPKPYVVLKYGLFLAGIGIGLLFGNILSMTTVLNPEAAYFSMILIFGGLGLGSYYLIYNKIIKKNN
jgi:ABC-type Fe3+-siderophore transport system permease subunit